MSSQLISRSLDLARLREEGFNLEARDGLLLVKDVPYVASRKQVDRGVFVTRLLLAGDRTGPPDDHVGYFIGDYPCDADGREIEQIRHSSGKQQLAPGVTVDHSFSAKPTPSGKYEDYHAKVTAYVAILSSPAKTLDDTATAQTFVPIVPEFEEQSVFAYADTASTRAGITELNAKLAGGKIAIVGVGGTGSYVLDLVAKTPVAEIHLFDGDTHYSHNAFRAPGATPLETLRAAPKKVDHFKNVYSKMHLGIVAHDFALDDENVSLLASMDFVFLCIDGTDSKRTIVEALERFALPFVDAGIGVGLTDGALGAILRITSSTPELREHVRNHISFAERDGDRDYDRNIQVADLNALTAALAVMKWKKFRGFYRDLEREMHSTYTADTNMIANDDRAP